MQQPFGLDSCRTIADGDDMNDPLNYIMKCPDIPVNLVLEEDYPHRPALSLRSSSDTICEGIATGIANSSYVDYKLLLQYGIYACLVCLGVYLFKQERKQKRYIRIALSLNGVFIPVREKERVKTIFTQDHPFLNNIISFIEPWFAIGLCVVYAISVWAINPSHEQWYVFPTRDETIAFNDVNDELSSNWCSVLTFPVKLRYSQSGNDFNIFSLIEVFLFLITIRHLSDTQAKIYDWVDSDEVLDTDQKELCPYYNIHQKRNRTFNELMLNDWIVKYIYLPVITDIMTSEKHEKLRELITKETVDKMKAITESIRAKL
jgi:hypothetical protein